MKAAVAVLAVAVVALAVWARSQSARIGELELSLNQQKTAANQRSAGLELQAKCADQARKSFTNEGWTKEPRAHYENHYNSG
jgi:hypothetical protein